MTNREKGEARLRFLQWRVIHGHFDADILPVETHVIAREIPIDRAPDCLTKHQPWMATNKDCGDCRGVELHWQTHPTKETPAND